MCRNTVVLLAISCRTFALFATARGSYLAPFGVSVTILLRDQTSAPSSKESERRIGEHYYVLDWSVSTSTVRKELLQSGGPQKMQGRRVLGEG